MEKKKKKEREKYIYSQKCHKNILYVKIMYNINNDDAQYFFFN